MSEENAGAAPAEAGTENAGGTPAAAGEQPSSWVDTLPDDLKGYVANKGWDEPAKVAQSYRELEKFAGSKANYMEMPDPNDPEAVSNVLRKLGAPEGPDGYNIELPEGVTPDENMMGAFKTLAAETHMTPAQAQKAVEWFEGYKQNVAESMQAESAEQSEKAIAALQKEWGADFDKNVAAGQKLVRATDISTEDIQKLEDHMGTSAVMNIMAKLGSKLGTTDLIGDDANSAYGMTPEMARSEISTLGASKDFRLQLRDPSNPGHRSATQKMQRLQEIAAGK